MLYFHSQKLVILCQPKTATTALHNAISSHASIALNDPATVKHLTYRSFLKLFRDKLEPGGVFRRKKYTFVAVMREPTEWFGSWYRFKARDQLTNNELFRHRSTENLTYNEFLENLLLPRLERPAHSQIASPCLVSLSSRNTVGVDYLFPYNHIDRMVDFVSEFIGQKVVLPEINVSKAQDLDPDPDLVRKLENEYRFEYDLYNALQPDGLVPKEFKQVGFKKKQKNKQAEEADPSE